jgi:CheY-like chemotaxis protein
VGRSGQENAPFPGLTQEIRSLNLKSTVASSQTDTAPLEGARPAPTVVLVVEDDDDSREMLSEFFVSRGYIVLQAANGPDGLRHALEHHPGIVFLDMTLPGLSGLDVAARLRDDAVARSIPLVAMTGRDLDPSQRQRFDAVVIKPADLDRLDRVIHDLVGRASPTLS